MENKKLGILFIVISLIFLGFLVYFNNVLYTRSDVAGCMVGEECQEIDNSLTAAHLAFGFFGFMFGLGFYLLFFNKTEESILKRLEEQKNAQVQDEKHSIIMKALDPWEQKAFKAIKEQDGITQNTLRLRTDMSKAKLSYVLQELEKRGLIKRTPKGKTLQVNLRV